MEMVLSIHSKSYSQPFLWVDIYLLIGGCFQCTFQTAQTRLSSKIFFYELIDCCVPRDAGRELLCVLDNVLCQGHRTQGNKITETADSRLQTADGG